MRNRNLTMGEMAAQFMAEADQGYNRAEFARRKRRGGRKQKRGKLALAGKITGGAAILGGTGYLAGTKKGRGMVRAGYNKTYNTAKQGFQGAKTRASSLRDRFRKKS